MECYKSDVDFIQFPHSHLNKGIWKNQSRLDWSNDLAVEDPFLQRM